MSDGSNDPRPGSESPTRRKAPRWLVRLGQATGVVGVALAVWVAVDLGPYLATPTQDSLIAKTAEWARERGMGDVVTGLEKLLYILNPPPVGGTPDEGIPSLSGPTASTQPPNVAKPPCQGPPLPSPAGTSLPNEGQWQTIGVVNSKPAIVAAFVRPDAEHTQFITGVTCTDPTLASFILHAGTELPGSTGWAEPPTVPNARRAALLATFNSGFLMADSMGGFWQRGKSVGALVPGQASMVFHADGHLDVRSWEGGSVHPDIVSVRQNLILLVDNGEITDPVLRFDSGAFGKTVGDATFVWRSGVGIRADGGIVTVHGNALSVQTLARLLQLAGCVRGMQLDINRDWTSYIYYQHKANGTLVPVKLTADQVRPADRYLGTSTRDFVEVTQRS